MGLPFAPEVEQRDLWIEGLGFTVGQRHLHDHLVTLHVQTDGDEITVPVTAEPAVFNINARLGRVSTKVRGEWVAPRATTLSDTYRLCDLAGNELVTGEFSHKTVVSVGDTVEFDLSLELWHE